MSSPVLAGDMLFGFSDGKRGHFFCLDAKTGETVWESPDGLGLPYTSIVNAGSELLFLTSKGRLIVVKSSAKSYEPIAEYQVSDKGGSAHPVFLGDRILIQDASTLRSFRVGPEAAKE
jgi:outer membrane protein assembly factor BamB